MKKKIFALSLAAAILSMTAACTTARNDGANTGTMAGSSEQNETGALSNIGTDSTLSNTNYNASDTDANRIDTRYNSTDATEADNLNTTDNGVIMDDTNQVVGGVVEDAARGMSNIAEDVMDGTAETGISGTSSFR